MEYRPLRGRDRVAVKHPHRKDKDMGSNPAVIKKRTLGDPPTEGSPMIQQDLSEDRQCKAELDLCKKEKKKYMQQLSSACLQLLTFPHHFNKPQQRKQVLSYPQVKKKG